MRIDEREVRQDASSYVDPGGAVFSYRGEILRGLRAESADFYASLLDEGHVVSRLLGREIVATERTDYELEGFALVLRHRKVDPLNFCFEWPPEMLREAALLTLDICLRLADHDLILQDAYPWNVHFEGPQAVFIDFTSIVPAEPDLVWTPYEQFCNFFLYPLYLYSLGRGEAARWLLHDYVHGVSVDSVARLLPAGSWLRRRGLLGRVLLPRAMRNLVRRTGSEEKLVSAMKKVVVSRQARLRFLTALRRTVAGIPLRVPQSEWRDYYQDMAAFDRVEAYDAKQQTIASVLQRVQPQTVVDIGCNRGGYSMMAANAGAKVIAFDPDESCISMLYQQARARQQSILPLVLDVTNPSPAFGHRASQFASANTRYRGELAFALALIHHLAFTQRQSFEHIVDALSDYTTRWLLVEFVPVDDEKSQLILRTNRRDLAWYTLDNFVTALKRQFRTCETLPSTPPQRSLLLCEK
jgi:hypothetical protein